MANVKLSNQPPETVLASTDLIPMSKDTGSGSFGSRGITGEDLKTSVNGKSTQRVITLATPTAILISDGFLLFDSSSNAIAIDLPAASVGKVEIPFKDSGAVSATNNITFNRVGADTIVDFAIGQTSTIISSNGYSGSFVSNGIDTWFLI